MRLILVPWSVVVGGVCNQCCARMAGVDNLYCGAPNGVHGDEDVVLLWRWRANTGIAGYRWAACTCPSKVVVLALPLLVVLTYGMRSR